MYIQIFVDSLSRYGVEIEKGFEPVYEVLRYVGRYLHNPLFNKELQKTSLSKM